MRQNKRLFTWAMCFGVIAVLVIAADAWTWTGVCDGISDGDTISVLQDGQPVKIRLYGIDCPEKGQAFSAKAKQLTANLVFRKSVRVDPVTRDRWGRVVAWVYVGAENVNSELVRAGLAWWYRKYAPGNEELKDIEASARAAKRGLWADPNPVPPWDWRRVRRQGPGREVAR